MRTDKAPSPSDRPPSAGRRGARPHRPSTSAAVATAIDQALREVIGSTTWRGPPDGAPSTERFAEFAGAWGKNHPAIVRLWENAWEEFTPFLRLDTEIRRIVCTTHAIGCVNAGIRRAVKAHGRALGSPRPVGDA
ncbi:transposase [Actinacidiphila glaucinigra]|uniref:transposase n=1 Tax=Actinacidiphila glaucinigra TaxID=235986 RepID=UPI00371DD660